MRCVATPRRSEFLAAEIERSLRKCWGLMVINRRSSGEMGSYPAAESSRAPPCDGESKKGQYKCYGGLTPQYDLYY
eukprot:6213662-Pleurochrysis_carterae.AAC.2